jgi:2-polyprenyl-3-methyl-5-hydroxy-6-metoxy-1,4-benzoquinol methylase
LLQVVAGLPNDLPVADVAGGTGRHAVPVARAGRHVVLVDIVRQAVAAAKATAGPALDGVVAEASRLPLRPGQFGIVMVANFLDREIFPELIALLAPGGYLAYETYTMAHLELVQRGLARGPHSLAYLLQPGELRELARPLTVVENWEGEVEDGAGRRCCARFVGQRAKRKAQGTKG